MLEVAVVVVVEEAFSINPDPYSSSISVAGNTGGQGAGITGYSRTQGGQPTTRNGGNPNSEGGGGAGGSLGESGVSDLTSAGAKVVKLLAVV